MNKKLITVLALVGVLTLGAGIGTTYASYKKGFSSTKNTLTSAKFKVDITDKNGTFKDSAFTVIGENLKPGTVNKNIYQFEVKKDTDVPVEYKIELKNTGDLFKTGTPVTVKLENLAMWGWKSVDLNSNFKPQFDTEKFRVILDWPMETNGVNDIDFAGKEGKIDIMLTATQVAEVIPSVTVYKGDASVTIQENNVIMSYKGTEGSAVTLKVVDSHGNIDYIDQGTIKDGVCEFKTRFDEPDKYYVTMNGSKGMVSFDEFEIE